jgi:hypothetical protein
MKSGVRWTWEREEHKGKRSILSIPIRLWLFGREAGSWFACLGDAGARPARFSSLLRPQRNRCKQILNGQAGAFVGRQMNRGSQRGRPEVRLRFSPNGRRLGLALGPPNRQLFSGFKSSTSCGSNQSSELPRLTHPLYGHHLRHPEAGRTLIPHSIPESNSSISQKVYVLTRNRPPEAVTTSSTRSPYVMRSRHGMASNAASHSSMMRRASRFSRPIRGQANRERFLQ